MNGRLVKICITLLWTIQHQESGRASCFTLQALNFCRHPSSRHDIDSNNDGAREKRGKFGPNIQRDEKLCRLMIMSTSSSHLVGQDLEIPSAPATTTTTTAIIQENNMETVHQDIDVIDTIPSTFSDAIQVFFFGSHQGPIIVLALIASLLYQRLAMIPSYPISISDYSLVFASMLFWCFQEHFIHGRLLHSKFNWFGKDIHHAHHEKPYFHISIDPVELLIGWMSVAYVIFRCILPSLSLATSATIGYATAGMWYEWTHYLVHTKVKPRSKLAIQVRDGHMKHHLVNHNYWLGFTVPFVDDLFGTNPSVMEARKEMKEVARTDKIAALGQRERSAAG